MSIVPPATPSAEQVTRVEVIEPAKTIGVEIRPVTATGSLLDFYKSGSDLYSVSILV